MKDWEDCKTLEELLSALEELALTADTRAIVIMEMCGDGDLTEIAIAQIAKDIRAGLETLATGIATASAAVAEAGASEQSVIPKKDQEREAFIKALDCLGAWNAEEARKVIDGVHGRVKEYQSEHLRRIGLDHLVEGDEEAQP